MKTKAIIIMLVVLILNSCEKENSRFNKLNVKSISLADCSRELKTFTSDFSCLSIKAIEDNYLLIQHHNSTFTCGTEKLEIGIKTMGDTILISERDLGPYTYCFCNRDVEYKIGPLENTQYNLKVVDPYQKDSIFISFKYSDKLVYSNCK